MRQRLERLGKPDEGFTLIELLIVIVILGVLAAVVVFSVSGISSRGTSQACKSDAASVQTASEAYYAQNSAYASNVTALVTANLLKSAPPTASPGPNGYYIQYTSGTVTGTLNSGAAC
jgi:general secretion pathway protein G